MVSVNLVLYVDLFSAGKFHIRHRRQRGDVDWCVLADMRRNRGITVHHNPPCHTEMHSARNKDTSRPIDTKDDIDLYEPTGCSHIYP